MADSSSGHRVDGRQESVGDLVALAVSDMSQLVKSELDLAKLELKEDVRRIALGAALLVVAIFTVCLILVMLCFAYAYGLMATNVPFVSWGWGAFLIVALTCAALSASAVAIGLRRFRGLTGMTKTRGTVSRGLEMFRRGDAHRGTSQAAKAPAARQAGDG